MRMAVDDVLAIMRERNLRRIPVVSTGQPVSAANPNR